MDWHSLDEQTRLAEIMARMPAAVTVLDLEGRLLFYNDYARKILDRKPEYLGRDVGLCHQPENAARIRGLLESYGRGRRGEYSYRTERQGRALAVRVAPWVAGGRCLGLIQIAAPLEIRPIPGV